MFAKENASFLSSAKTELARLDPSIPVNFLPSPGEAPGRRLAEAVLKVALKAQVPAHQTTLTRPRPISSRSVPSSLVWTRPGPVVISLLPLLDPLMSCWRKKEPSRCQMGWDWRRLGK